MSYLNSNLQTNSFVPFNTNLSKKKDFHKLPGSTDYSPYQVAVSNERAAAHVALVVLAGRVRPYVHGELRLAGECHGAAIAAERLFRHVRPSAE